MDAPRGKTATVSRAGRLREPAATLQGWVGICFHGRLIGADSLQPGDGGDNDDDRCDAANAVPPRLVDATTLTDDDYQVLDAAVVATMAGKGGDSPEFHLARALLNQIRPEYWQSLTTVAQCAMTRRAY